MQQPLEFICDYCNRIFTRKYNLQMHIESNHLTSTSIVCHICNQGFGTTNGLQLHFARGHNRYSQPFPECDMCGRIFTRKQNIVSHMITVHLQGLGSEFICIYCSKTFSSEKNLKRHRNQLHNPNLEYVTCVDCNKVYKGKDLLASHMDNMHNIAIKGSMRCHLCEKVFLNPRYLKQHVDMIHLEKYDHKCSLCPKFYTSNSGLKRHMKSVHNIVKDDSVSEEFLQISTAIIKKEPDSFSCEMCSDVFNSPDQVRFHLKVYHAFKVFYKYCCQYANIKVDNAFIFFCEYCSGAFHKHTELQTHMQSVHSIEYYYTYCNVCFNKFYSKQTRGQHSQLCIPPPDAHHCNFCERLFTKLTSLEFHTRIFHPEAVDNITSTNTEESDYKCKTCNRCYYNERSLQQHIKLKHSLDDSVECVYCNKIFPNRYYLASHMKVKHCEDAWLKCDYCKKYFKSKRNIRRHIEHTHLNMQRFECLECSTLFKEKRSLRKHLRTKHPGSVMFPKCRICKMSFESIKACKLHLKVHHSQNIVFTCDSCSVSYDSNEDLLAHIRSYHPNDSRVYKCNICDSLITGIENYSQHKHLMHNSYALKQKLMPRCIICVKDFSSRKTLKRHIKKFHPDFDVEELATFGTKKRSFVVHCEDCIKNFGDQYYINIYQKLKNVQGAIIFKCEYCKGSYSAIEFAVQKYKCVDAAQSKMVLSELCTTEMSDEDPSCSEIGSTMDSEPVSTTTLSN